MAENSRSIVGVANPRALAELRAGERIDWDRVDGEATIAKLLETPYENLFDPKFGSPLYAGVPIDLTRKLVDVRVVDQDTLRDRVRALKFDPLVRERLVNRRLLEHGTIREGVVDRPAFTDAPVAQVGAAKKVAGEEQVARLAHIAQTARAVQLADARPVRHNERVDLHEFGRDIVVLPPDWFGGLFSNLTFGVQGEFAEVAPTITSPVQGGLADCYLVSAMASLAWVRPEEIAERMRRDDQVGDVTAGGADFLFSLHEKLDLGIAKIEFVFPVWIGEQIPTAGGGTAVYARSSVPNETWPALLEKAFVVWRSGGNKDVPRSEDYDVVAFGDAAWACYVLTGNPPWYHWADAADAWSTIQSNCADGRATTPLVAWTWGSGDASPAKVDYASAGLVANPAYSILGTWELDGECYVVLRNPWGWREATLNTASGTWGTREAWGTSELTLPGDGVFALRIDTFRECFMGFGGAK